MATDLRLPTDSIVKPDKDRFLNEEEFKKAQDAEQAKRWLGNLGASVLAWWRAELGDDLAPLELPLDRPRPARHTPAPTGSRRAAGPAPR